MVQRYSVSRCYEVQNFRLEGTPELGTGNTGAGNREHRSWEQKRIKTTVPLYLIASETAVIVANNDLLSPQPVLVVEMMAIIHCFSCRLYRTRNYKKKLKENLYKNLDKQVECQQDIQC
ncbi:MAG: hypothetical protein WBA93_21430 [Microcoleaceae cyanobacterium]